jgi:hypothetical protein
MNCLPVVTSSFLRRKAVGSSLAPVYTFAKDAISREIPFLDKEKPVGVTYLQFYEPPAGILGH